jgi:hypothetical protein
MSPLVALASRQLYLRQDIQDDSGRKVNILGGDCVGHCEKKVYLNNSECLPKDTAVGMYV